MHDRKACHRDPNQSHLFPRLKVTFEEDDLLLTSPSSSQSFVNDVNRLRAILGTDEGEEGPWREKCLACFIAITGESWVLEQGELVKDTSMCTKITGILALKDPQRKLFKVPMWKNKL